MTYRNLAKQLRERQIAKGLIPIELINAVSDVDIVESYFECANCQKNIFAEELQLKLIRESLSVDEFVEAINIGLKRHKQIAHEKN